MLFAKKLHSGMDEYLPPEKFIGKTVSRRTLSAALNNVLRPHSARARVVLDKSKKKVTRVGPSICSNICLLSGWFDSTQDLEVPLQITIHVTQPDGNLSFTKARFDDFRYKLSRIAQHEAIHRKQFAHYTEDDKRTIKIAHSPRVGKRRLEWISYLNDWWEVEAYAHDIAMDIARFYPSKDPVTVIKQIDNHRKLPSYNLYRWTYKGTDWDPLRKSLLQKAWKCSSSVVLPNLTD